MMLLVLALAGMAGEENPSPEVLEVPVGRSIILELPADPAKTSITDPSCATVHTLDSPRSLLLLGLEVGTTDLVVAYGAGKPPVLYEVSVQRDLAPLKRAVDRIVERSR